MSNAIEEKKNDQAPEWLVDLLPIFSAFIGGGALWYAWLKYNDYMNQPDIVWYEWIQPPLIILVGVICLSATLLFIKNKSSGWNVLGAGLSLIPVILLLNLFIFATGLIAKGFGYAGGMIQKGEGLFGGTISRFPEMIVGMSPINIALQAVIILLVVISVAWKMKIKRSGKKNEE